MAEARSHELLGRDEETRAIEALLDRPTGAELLLVGEPGIGKSAMLRAAARSAQRRGRVVLTAFGVQSEARLPFAGLHQLVRPLSERFAGLTSRQRAALGVAFGTVDGPAADVFAVAMAVLDLLTNAATDTGLLVVVDDLHWIDDATADVLAFVARRLAADPIMLLAAARPGYAGNLTEAGVASRHLPPLRDHDAEQLLRMRHPHLDPERRVAVLEQAAGNPLALVELPLAVGSRGDTSPPGIALTARLERSFAARLAELDPTARFTAVLAAAADDGATVGEVLDAVIGSLRGTAEQRQRQVEEAVEVARAAGLVEVSFGRIGFSHPLMRSAIYQAAGAGMRRRAHRALAEVLEQHPERRAWHRAAAALGPDEAVAADLDLAARSAEHRGAREASARAWEQAAALTPGRGSRATRLLRAAELSLDLGNARHSAELATTAEPLVETPADRARLTLLRDALIPGLPGDPVHIGSLADLARALIESGEIDLAFRLLLAAAVRVWSADPGPDARALLMSVTDRLPGPADDPRRLAIGGFVYPARFGAVIARRVAALDPKHLDPASADLAMSVHLVGAAPAVLAVQRAVVEAARNESRLAALPRMLTQQVWSAIVLAEWAVAVPSADEAVRIARETRQPLWEATALTGQAMIAGLRGDEEQAGGLAQRAEALTLPARMSAVLCGIQLVRGVTAIGAGRYDEAFDHLIRLFDPSDVAYQDVQSSWALGDLAEAAAHTGRVDQARDIVARFAADTDDAATAWTRTAVRYARPLLSRDDTAEEEFRRALATDLSRWPTYRARLMLEYGSWLRRRRQVAEARAPLRTARQSCEALGLLPWAERARRELRATGERSEKPRAEQWASLSPQELHIAQLAAEGLSNREIGQRLFLSHRTVGSHLYRIFPKLGIGARGQLRSVLSSLELNVDSGASW